ncbi:FecR family protein [Candidatus Woesearchaeota archaeon]|nr:FecR family protein [Candidatus Woesearchaeota archaeon]
MKKWFIYAGVAVVVLIAVAAVFVFSNPAAPALLFVDRQMVEVDSGKGYTQATDNMKLGENDKVRTLDGEAYIIFFESEILQLDPNTEIQISDLSKDFKVKQASGNTWSRVMKLTGMNSYSVETPSSVITVRGTGFGVGIGAIEKVLLADGQVDFGSLHLSGLEKGMLADGDYLKAELTEEEKAYIKKKLEKDVMILKKLRQMIIEDDKISYAAIKAFAKLDDEGIKKYLEEIDMGMHDPDELAEQAPIQTRSITSVTEISKKIIELNKLIEILS